MTVFLIGAFVSKTRNDLRFRHQARASGASTGRRADLDPISADHCPIDGLSIERGHALIHDGRDFAPMEAHPGLRAA
jgi:hypothetical protein